MLRLLLVLGSRRPRARAVLAVLGIAVGVALGYGVHLVNRAAVADLAAAVREVAGEADLEVRAGREGFPESLYPRVARVEGVGWASAGLELDAGVAGSERSVRVVGLDAVRERYPELLEGDKVLLSTSAAQLLEPFLRGNRLPLAVGGAAVELEVAGTAGLKGVVAVADVATAQWRLDRLGVLNRIRVRLEPGADAAAVAARIGKLLPPGVFVAQVGELEQASAGPSRAYRVNMNVLAMVALFTGGFLVFSAQALEMARRRGEHALLRVLGLTGAQLRRLALLESALLGALGSAAGLALGYGLAALAVGLFGADLGAGAFRGLRPDLSVPFAATLLYFGAGVAVALVGAGFSARDAARAPPARALKPGDEQAVLARVAPAWPGLALLAAGAALAQLGPVRGLPLFGYASIACILLGSIALMPRLAQAVLARAALSRPTFLALALAQLRGAPGQAAVSLAAIVASFALMAAMAIMVSSFRDSVDRWLDTVLPAHVYVRTAHGGDTAALAPGFVEGLRALPGVARVELLRSARVALEPARPPLPLIARDNAAHAFPLVGPAHERRPGDPPPAWVSEALADLHGLAPGKTIELPLAGRMRPFIVRGVFRDYARQHGAFLVERADYVALTGDRRVNDAAVWLEPGTSPAQAMEAMRALPGGAQAEMAQPGEIRALSLRIFDRSFAVTYAMEAVAMLVGLFGLSSSLGAIVLARRREFGVLRHIGVTRRQVGAMLAAEGAVLALLGALAGLAAGAAMSVVLVHVVNRQSFHWGMELRLPLGFLALLVAVLVVLSVATAVLAGREATGQGPLRAVKDDW